MSHKTLLHTFPSPSDLDFMWGGQGTH